jgi:nitrite reductase/ring-hydroxylating ferredoxin subunit
MALSAVGLGLTLGAGYLGGHLSFVRGVGVNHTAFDGTVVDWTDVAGAAELTTDKPVRVTAGGEAVMRSPRRGSARALGHVCTCRWPLYGGEIIDGCVRCPWHPSRFGLADGRVVRGPAALDQPTRDVREDGGRVYVRSSIPRSRDSTRRRRLLPRRRFGAARSILGQSW